MNHGRLTRKDDGRVIAEVFETSGFLERMCGLLFRNPLENNQALLISPCSSVHTFGMRYSIDLVYLDESLTIIKTVVNLKPWRISACRSASAVLELAAHRCEQLNLDTGQQLVCQTS